MSPLQLVFGVFAIAYAAGRWLQERKFLAEINAMPAAQARIHYETHRRRHDRFLMVLTAVFCSAAAGALGYSFLIQR